MAVRDYDLDGTLLVYMGTWEHRWVFRIQYMTDSEGCPVGCCVCLEYLE